MSLRIHAQLVWIPATCGGRSSPPFEGYRPGIRFQRDIPGWVEVYRDVQVDKLDLDEGKSCGTATLKMSKDATLNLMYVKEGELIEILEGDRVVAVGRILSVVVEGE